MVLHILIHKDYIRHILTFVITIHPSNMLSCSSESDCFLYIIIQQNRKDVCSYFFFCLGINFNDRPRGNIMEVT